MAHGAPEGWELRAQWGADTGSAEADWPREPRQGGRRHVQVTPTDSGWSHAHSPAGFTERLGCA